MFTPPTQRIKLHKVTVTRCTSQGCNFFYTFTGQHCWTAAGCWRHLSSNSHRNQFQLQLIFDSCRAPMPFGPKILTWIWQSLIWCHLDKMSFRVCLWSWGSCCQFQSCHGWASCPGAIFLLTSATFYQLGITCLVTWPSFHLIKDTCCQLQCLYKWQFPLKCTKLNLLCQLLKH